jgi:tRNA(Ile)-lysidine synthase
MSGSSQPANEPIRSDERDALFAPLGSDLLKPCALAVSGGSDSTALMVLWADWLARQGGEASLHTVITVDHGLRPQAADEARAVARQAAALGFRHVTLTWPDPKPQSGLQEAARGARYRLMGDYMRAHGIGLLLTAHTRDDLAETLLMRLARGSGLDGLAAMAPRLSLSDLGFADAAGAPGPDIARPLLGMPKARLRATLEVSGVAWMEDASNRSPAFERSRLRAARAQLDALGLTDAKLALSATRLLRVRRALEHSVAQFCDPAAGAVTFDACGVIVIDRARLQAAEGEIALRVLARAIAAAGGSDQPVPLAKLETIVETIERRDAESAKWTLARATITAKDRVVLVEREPGREPLPRIVLQPGERARWDGRFDVQVARKFANGLVEVRALDEATFSKLREQGAVTTRVSPRLAATVPSFWGGEVLVAVPSLDYWATPHARQCLTADFAWTNATRDNLRVSDRS